MNPESPLPPRLERVHRWVHAQPWLRRFTVMNRLLLAMAFLPTGLVKVTGQRFTTLPVDNPVGFFFEAMYRTGPYWNFIGLVQVAAAVLLLIPATATVGAVLFVPVITSIVLITWGVGFGNTAIITTAMLLAAVYLVCWDGDRIWAAASHLVGRRRSDPLFLEMGILERVGWATGGVAGMGLLLITRSFLPRPMTKGLLVLGLTAAVLVVLGWTSSLRRPASPATAKGG